ncbi:MAG: hypothetical protein AAFR34_03450 [Pseudomonadota bacterium]
MNRSILFAILGLGVVVFVIAVATDDIRNATVVDTADTPVTPAPDTEASDDIAVVPTPDVVSEGAAAQTEIARSDTGAASNLATDAAVQALAETGRPVQGAIDEVREIADAFGTVGAEAGETTNALNDEAALDAPVIDPQMAMDPEFVAMTLAPEDFDAERVVALIDATPHLNDTQKIDLRVAVQAVSQAPEVREDVLARLEDILILDVQ